MGQIPTFNLVHKTPHGALRMCSVRSSGALQVQAPSLEGILSLRVGCLDRHHSFILFLCVYLFFFFSFAHMPFTLVLLYPCFSLLSICCFSLTGPHVAREDRKRDVVAVPWLGQSKPTRMNEWGPTRQCLSCGTVLSAEGIQRCREN